jgi:EAL and modified HD-GYP domain-containing signal transduction protein
MFLLGLLSLMDAILELPMSDVLDKVSIDQETKNVLLGSESYLRPLYQLMLAQESGDWRASGELARTLKLPESEVAESYWKAMQWAKEMSGQ